MKPLAGDTAPEVEERLISGLRDLTPEERLLRVVELNRLADELARAGIRLRHGAGLDGREVELRLAALGLDADVMRSAFGWDPDREGY